MPQDLVPTTQFYISYPFFEPPYYSNDFMTLSKKTLMNIFQAQDLNL